MVQSKIKILHKNEFIKYLPNSFIEFIKKPKLKKNCFRYFHPSLNQWVIDGIGCLFKIYGKKMYTIEGELNSPPELFPSNLIPFAVTGGGDYLCFNKKNNKNIGEVYFWLHEEDVNNNVVKLANSFEEFMTSLLNDQEAGLNLNFDKIVNDII